MAQALAVRLPEQPEASNIVPGMDEEAIRRRCLKIHRQLDAIYTRSWKPTQWDIVDYIQPNHGQFSQAETNLGVRKDIRVLNNYATEKAGKLSSAIDVGVCSEAREWWVAALLDTAAMEDQGNREYLHDYQEALSGFIAAVGWYGPNRSAIDDMVNPATGVVVIEEDAKNWARCTHLPVGRYRLAVNARGEHNLLTDVYTLTAAQMVEEFGEEKCSPAVRLAMQHNDGQLALFTVLRFIEERPAHLRQHGKIDAANMPWACYWLEVGAGYVGSIAPGAVDVDGGSSPNGLLRQSGFHEQPFYVYTWFTLDGNAYGTDSPGWRGIGDVKELQDMELGSAGLNALLLRPPMNRPAGLADGSMAPGADNPIPDNARIKFEPSYVPSHDSVTVTEAKIARIEQRINATFLGDILFLLSGNTNVEPKTAEEIRGIKEERLLQLGGVFAKMSDQLRVALRRLAGIAHRAGRLPEPPQTLLKGKHQLVIDFVNPLVTAQKAIGFTGIQQIINLAVQLAEARKAGDDKLNGDEIMDESATMLGLKPNLLHSDDELAQSRQAAADQANADAQGKALPEAAASLKDLSNADPEKLRSLVSGLSPNAGAQATTPGG